MNIALLEPYYGGSHKYWADSLKRYSTHNIDLYTLPARHWKWRMEGSAISLAQKILESANDYELILASDMIDLGLLRSLLKKNIPYILYMHENQLLYPLSELDKQKDVDLSYGYLNYKSCLSADKIIFNSDYHRKVFLEAVDSLLSRMPDYRNKSSVETIRNKSTILPIPLTLETNYYVKQEFKTQVSSNPCTLLWNHRWDHDKNPVLFSRLLDHLDSKGFDFRLILTAHPGTRSEVFETIENKYKHKLLFSGYIESRSRYIEFLKKSDLLAVPPGQDFFGISVLEAVYYGATPLLPSNCVYEDHFPLAKFPEIYYSDPADLFAKTINFLNGKLKVSHKKLAERIEVYKKEIVIQSYDRYLKHVLLG